jgi:predicted nucleic acid-binding protein
MSAQVFLDTNILIYGYSQDEPDKRQRAIECIQSGKVWISTQVLNETINVSYGRSKKVFWSKQA